MSILDVAGPIINKLLTFIPDPIQKAAAQLELFKAQQQGEFKELDAQVQLATGQTDINKVEAANPSVFVSGWRPYIGWTCGIAISYHFVVWPWIEWVAKIYKLPDMPIMDMQDLFPLVLGMLGLVAARSYDKKNGVA